MFAKMDSELLTCLLKCEYSPDYLSALSRTLLRFFGQPLSKPLYIAQSSCSFYKSTQIHDVEFVTI